MSSIEITTKIGCANKCSYCPQDKLIGTYKKISDIFEMSLETFKKCLDKIPGEVNINFSGFCEPWLNSNCSKMILYAYSKGHQIEIFTTLVGMRLEDIEIIKDIPFKRFVVHIPTIVIDSQYEQIMVRVATKIPNITYMYFDEIQPKLKPWLKTIRAEKWNLSSRAGNIRKRGTERLLGVIKCLRYLNRNVLLPNGNVVLCCNDYGMKHILGNLLESDYHSLFLGEEYRKVLKGLSDDSVDILCRYCDNFVVKENV